MKKDKQKSPIAMKRELAKEKRELEASKADVKKLQGYLLDKRLALIKEQSVHKNTEEYYENVLDIAVERLNNLSKEKSELQLKYERVALALEVVVGREFEVKESDKTINQGACYSIYDKERIKSMVFRNKTIFKDEVMQ